MKCIFCEGEDVHDCPGGKCTVHDSGAFSLSSGPYDMDVFPGKVDARAFQPPKYETRLSIEREYNFPVMAGDVETTKPHANLDDEAFVLRKPRGGFELL